MILERDKRDLDKYHSSTCNNVRILGDRRKYSINKPLDFLRKIVIINQERWKFNKICGNKNAVSLREKWIYSLPMRN